MKNKYSTRERMRKDALRSNNGFMYYRLCNMLAISDEDIEDYQLYSSGKEISDKVEMEDYIKYGWNGDKNV